MSFSRMDGVLGRRSICLSDVGPLSFRDQGRPVNGRDSRLVITDPSSPASEQQDKQQGGLLVVYGNRQGKDGVGPEVVLPDPLFLYTAPQVSLTRMNLSG